MVLQSAFVHSSAPLSLWCHRRRRPLSSSPPSSLSSVGAAALWGPAAVHPDWQRVDVMRNQVMEYFRARKEDQPLQADELRRRPCTAVEERLEVCQWLEELRAL
jgi:hypothetical protein